MIDISMPLCLELGNSTDTCGPVGPLIYTHRDTEVTDLVATGAAVADRCDSTELQSCVVICLACRGRAAHAAWRPKITDSPKRKLNAPDCFLQVLRSGLIVGCVMLGRVICLRRQL